MIPVFTLHTGCRTGAVCSLRVEDVREPSTGLMRPVGSVMEKGGAQREFEIDPILSAALEGAIARNRGSAYVFPANRGVGRRQESQNDAWIRRLCARCRPPIIGSHVHMHALRLVNCLVCLGGGRLGMPVWETHRAIRCL